MESNNATTAFASLGHPGRLAVFRMLMRLLPQAARPTEIALALDLKANTLSHYLSDLERVGLIQSARRGKSLFYSVDLKQTRNLIGYLVDDCCRSRPDLCPPLIGKPDMMQKPYNVLFICSGNSARSIFAEAILNAVGADKFRAFSAGTRPGSQINPFALEIVQRAGYDTTQLRAKHVSEFETADAPQMDFVFTVCDTAAAEECAPWPGQPITAHWGVNDPVASIGTDAEKALAFSTAFAELDRRITAFANLSFPQLDRLALQRSVDCIGQNQA